MSGRKATEAANNVSEEGFMLRRFRNRREEGGVAPKDEDSLGCGPVVAPHSAAIWLLGYYLAVVVSAKQGIQRTVKTMVTRCTLEVEGAWLRVKGKPWRAGAP